MGILYSSSLYPSLFVWNIECAVLTTTQRGMMPQPNSMKYRMHTFTGYPSVLFKNFMENVYDGYIISSVFLYYISDVDVCACVCVFFLKILFLCYFSSSQLIKYIFVCDCVGLCACECQCDVYSWKMWMVKAPTTNESGHRMSLCVWICV